MRKSGFRRIAQRALTGLPEAFRPYVADCLLVVQRRPSPRLLEELEVAEDEDLFGLYEGPALTERSNADPPELPPRIILFYEPLLEACATEEELVHEIQVTVLHEIGHHFGLDEQRLEELGFG